MLPIPHCYWPWMCGLPEVHNSRALDVYFFLLLYLSLCWAAMEHTGWLLLKSSAKVWLCIKKWVIHAPDFIPRSSLPKIINQWDGSYLNQVIGVKEHITSPLTEVHSQLTSQIQISSITTVSMHSGWVEGITESSFWSCTSFRNSPGRF